MTNHPDPVHDTAGADVEPVAPRGRRRRVGRAVLNLVLAGAIFVGGVGFERLQYWEYTEASEFERIGAAWETLYAEYVDVDALDPRELAYGAITGMAEAVGDTYHTAFLTPDAAAVGAAFLSGSPAGIGIWMNDMGDSLRVTSLDPDAPAILSGMRIGDRIIAVDSASTEGSDGELVLDRIIGQAGATVTVTVDRPGEPDPLHFRLVRELLELESVDWTLVPGTTTGLVQLLMFSEHAGDEVAEAVRAAQAAGATNLVLDLRGNPGGLVDEAIAVAAVFLEPGQVVFRERDRAGEELTQVVPPDASPTDLPLVVLVDGDSASSSEVVAAALQEAKRATIVGTTTAGTGTILSDYEFDDGSVLSIGIARWFTPSGRSVWHVGLTPDLVRSLPAGELATTVDGLRTRGLAASRDTQLLAAVNLLSEHVEP